MNIYESITAIMQEVPAIGKNKENQQQHFKFRGIDDVMNALQPLLAKHKVFIVPEILEQRREERVSQKSGGNLIYSICTIKYKFYAEDGTFIEAVTIGEGMDSGDKATNKSMAIAMKYALFQVFCIPTEEMKDPDGDTPEPTQPAKITPAQVKVLQTLIKPMSNNLEFYNSLLETYKVKDLADLKAEDFKKIIKDLQGEQK